MDVDGEVTAADIARIAGVGRAAVSNWRRRHADFPAPTGGPPNSPTFSWPAVEKWLRSNGRLDASGGRSAPGPQRSDPAVLDLGRCMVALLPRLGEGLVFDPACGDGALLVAACERFGPGVRYAGQDLDQVQVEAAREALARSGAEDVTLLVPGRPGELAVALRGRADVVVSTAPSVDRLPDGFPYEFGQPVRTDHALGWVQLCLSYLRPGGVAVVAVPFAVAVRASARRIRGEFLRAGLLTQVVGLPNDAPGTGTGLWQVWTLTKPVGRPRYQLRLVDLNDQSPEQLPQDEDAWTDVLADPDRAAELHAIEILDEDTLLVPSAHIQPAARDVTPVYAQLRDAYRAGLERLPVSPPHLRAGDPTALGDLVSVADLVRSGSVAFIDRQAARSGDVVVPLGTGGFDAAVISAAGIGALTAGPVLRCDPDNLDPHFLACFLRSEINRRQAVGTSGGTFRLDVRRARVPRLPLSEQSRYGRSFQDLVVFDAAADEVAKTAREATRTAIYGLTSGAFAPGTSGE